MSVLITITIFLFRCDSSYMQQEKYNIFVNDNYINSKCTFNKVNKHEWYYVGQLHLAIVLNEKRHI